MQPCPAMDPCEGRVTKNGELRASLTELPAHVEALEVAAARSLDAEVWRELVASTERRKLGVVAL